MKQKLFAVLLISFLFSPHFNTAQNVHKQTAAKAKWVAKNPFEQKVIIENKGQYQIAGKLTAKDILFGARQGGLQYYFTSTGIIISKFVAVNRFKKETEQLEQKKSEKEDNDDDSWKYKTEEQFSEMNFEGANPQVTLTADSEMSWYYNFEIKGNSTLKAHAWKKLTYNNLYPGIDMEFYFPGDNDPRLNDSTDGHSFEYSFIVHPGADISQIKIKYNGDLNVNPDGSTTIKSPYGNFIQYAPAAKLLSSNTAVNCNFSFSNGRLKFNTGNYDKSETLLIDPLTITPPAFNGSDDAYDVDWDDAGDIYAYGGDYPWEILKYNSSGTMLWSYTKAINTNNTDDYLGDFAVDRHSQSVYITEGVDDGPGSQVLKLNQAGGAVTTYPGKPNFNEMWKIAFSTCSNQAVIAGGGNTTPSYTASYLDTDLTTLNLVNTLNDQVSGYHDVWSLAIDDFGSAYIITAHSHSTIDPDSFNNVMLKLPLPNLSPTTWLVKSHYDYLEIASLTYGYNEDNSAPGNGYNGMAISDTILYTYDSYIIKKWDTHNGKLLDSVDVNGIPEDNDISWGGIAVDDCGNTFVGSRDTVKQYDYNLNFVQVYPEPYYVYDVKLSTSDTLYAAGIDFISAMGVTLPPCHLIQAVNTITNAGCNTLGAATITQSGGTAPYSIVWNTTPVITGDTATALKKGTYIATISDSSCPRQIYEDTVKILGPIRTQISTITDTVCQGLPVTITVYNASDYVWTPSTGLNTTAGSSVIATPTVTTTYNVVGVVINGGCLDTEQVVINVNPPPILTISPQQPAVCIGQTVKLTASGAPAYQWSPVTGLSSSTGATVEANPTITTTYTLFGTSSLGCTDSSQFVLQVNPIPIVTVVPSTNTICTGKTVTLSASGASIYQWSPSSGLSETSGSSITATPTISTTYTAIGTSSAGCSDTTTVAISVVTDSLKAIPGNASVCKGTSVVITASGANNYNWSPSTGLNKTTGDTVIASPVSATTYNVTGIGVGGCSDTATVDIIVIQPPAITITPSQPSICNGQTILLTASGATAYEWSPATGLSTATGSKVDADPTITTTYTVYGDSLGCKDSITFTLDVNSVPSGTFTKSVLSVCDPLQQQFSNGVMGGTSYLWNFGDGDTSAEQNPVHAFKKQGIYIVTLITTSANGCSDTISVIDTLSTKNVGVFVPNSFTPTVPGLNQKFRPNFDCIAPSNYLFRVYDRWGLMMYETSDVTAEGWDGIYKGKMQPLDVYEYYVELTCGTCTFFKKGDVTLLK